MAATPATSWVTSTIRAKKTGGFAKVFDLTAGTSSVGTTIFQCVLSNTKTRIGGATTDFAGGSEISVVGVWHPYHSDDEEFSLKLMKPGIRVASSFGENVRISVTPCVRGQSLLSHHVVPR